jgi:hypothetical protein
MTPKMRRALPGGSSAPSGDDVEFAGFDFSTVTEPASDNQASLRHRAQFARSMVFAAIDYGRFVDRRPDQTPRYWRST